VYDTKAQPGLLGTREAYQMPQKAPPRQGLVPFHQRSFPGALTPFCGSLTCDGTAATSEMGPGCRSWAPVASATVCVGQRDLMLYVLSVQNILAIFSFAIIYVTTIKYFSSPKQNNH
jgi:hypothetical protein